MLEYFGANTSEYFINRQVLVLVLYPYSLHGNTFRGGREKKGLEKKIKETINGQRESRN